VFLGHGNRGFRALFGIPKGGLRRLSVEEVPMGPQNEHDPLGPRYKQPGRLLVEASHWGPRWKLHSHRRALPSMDNGQNHE
jgi:hypothetical protein